MKKKLLAMILGITLLPFNAFSAERATLQNGDGEEIGTAVNPLFVTGAGGASGTLELSTIYPTGKRVSPINTQNSATLVTYNGNQYAGLWDTNTKLTLCKRTTDAVAWTCEIYNGTPDAATFSGSGLNDLTSGGTATSGITATSTYEVTIDATGTPDTFKWRLNAGGYTSGVAITGAAQTLSNGVQVTFAATTGHTLNDTWSIRVNPAITVNGDVHQGVGLGFDSNGIMHVNAGSYTTEGGLKYRRLTSSESIDGISAELTIDPGTNCGGSSCDGDASYVVFWNDSSMGLYAMFRSNGGSGNADTTMWKYNPASEVWAAAPGTSSGTFIGASSDSRAAYISHPYIDSNNKAHLVFTWRDNAASPQYERGLSYVRYDMTNGDFEKADGSAQTIPIRYSNDDSIDAAGEDGVNVELEGMQYRTPIAHDADGNLRVVYTKNDYSRFAQLFLKTHNGTSWSSSATQIISTADVANYPDHRASLFVEGNNGYIIYASATDGTGINVLETSDWLTFKKYAIFDSSMGQYMPGYGLFTVDRRAWISSKDIYLIIQHVGFDFQNLTASRAPIYILRWDPSSRAGIRQHHSYGAVNYDDYTIGSINGYLRPFGTIKYDNQSTWFLESTDDIDTWASATASDGDVVELSAGTITITADIDVTKQITIRGQGGYSQGCKTTISNATASVFVFDIQTNNVRLEDLCITSSGSASRGISAVRGTSGVWTGLYFKDVGIVMTGAGTKIGAQLNNVSGAADHLYMSITSSDSSARGLYYFNTSTANAATTFTCENCYVITTANATNSKPYEGAESTASQDGTLTLRNCVGIADETAAGAASVAVNATGGANGIVYVQGGWFDGTDSDMTQATSAVLNVYDVNLVNGTTSGTITYLGTKQFNNGVVAGDLSGDGGDQISGFLSNQIASTTTTLTAAQCFSTIVNDSADVVTLPEASTVLGCRYTFIVGNVSNFDINPNDASDQIVLLTNAAGDAIRADAIGESVTLEAIAANAWAPVGAVQGTWTDVD